MLFVVLKMFPCEAAQCRSSSFRGGVALGFWLFSLGGCFGKRTMMDYVLVILLNGLYIFNLGMSYDTAYLGPVYGKHIPTDNGHTSPSMS